MKVTLDPANNSSKCNPPELQVNGCVFSVRKKADEFVEHLRREIDLLWPRDDTDINVLLKDKK